MSYAISLYRQYNRILIVLTFVISSMKYEVSKKTVQNKVHPFLRQYSCQPWAKMRINVQLIRMCQKVGTKQVYQN
ncbi:hypothetical protein BDB01DRAFT_790570 [Pilobolus umbonatus]|nr:hypothetical protein BDB01DRAFT_790570 [Pilobolus umbonatus]